MRRERKSSGMPGGLPKNLPNTYKIWPVRPSVERRKGENNMKIRHRCACMVMIGGRLLGTGGIGQAQLGGGTSPGGTGKRVRSPSEKRRWNGNHGPRARIVGD